MTSIVVLRYPPTQPFEMLLLPISRLLIKSTFLRLKTIFTTFESLFWARFYVCSREFSDPYAPMVRTSLQLLKERGLSHRRPLKLKNSVSQTRKTLGTATCVSEMNAVMSCWKMNDFNGKPCSQEIKAFLECASRADATRKSEGRADLGTTELSPSIVTDMLRKTPRP